MDVRIRLAIKNDLPEVHELIRELALFEKSPEQVITTVSSMEKDGFGDDPLFTLIVAEVDHKVVGMALYFIKYSTWRGKGIYLDDLIVTGSYRGKGIGAKLLEAVFSHAKQIDARQLHWQVLDWNTPAIEFYKKVGARIEAEWLDCKVDLPLINTPTFKSGTHS
jgi:GNAT superfamily N-acetyltransferase